MSAEPVEAYEGLVPITYSNFGLFGTSFDRTPEFRSDMPLIQACPGVVLFTAGRSDQKDHVRLEVYDGPAPTEAEGYEEYASLDVIVPAGPMRILWDFCMPVDGMEPVDVPRLANVQAWVLGRQALRKTRGIPADGTSRWLIRVGPGTVEPTGPNWYAEAQRL